jgi:hypothetical protein
MGGALPVPEPATHTHGPQGPDPCNCTSGGPQGRYLARSVAELKLAYPGARLVPLQPTEAFLESNSRPGSLVTQAKAWTKHEDGHDTVARRRTSQPVGQRDVGPGVGKTG